MPLTQHESEFLEAFIDEYMTGTLGPAGRKLQEHGLLASDSLHLLDAYSRANPPRLEHIEVDGRLVEALLWGRPNPNPLDPPWSDRETVQRRNADLLAEKNVM